MVFLLGSVLLLPQTLPKRDALSSSPHHCRHLLSHPLWCDLPPGEHWKPSRHYCRRSSCCCFCHRHQRGMHLHCHCRHGESLNPPPCSHPPRERQMASPHNHSQHFCSSVVADAGEGCIVIMSLSLREVLASWSSPCNNNPELHRGSLWPCQDIHPNPCIAPPSPSAGSNILDSPSPPPLLKLPPHFLCHLLLLCPFLFLLESMALDSLLFLLFWFGPLLPCHLHLTSSFRFSSYMSPLHVILSHSLFSALFSLTDSSATILSTSSLTSLASPFVLPWLPSPSRHFFSSATKSLPWNSSSQWKCIPAVVVDEGEWGRLCPDVLLWLQVIGRGGCVTSCAVPTPNNNIYPSL